MQLLKIGQVFTIRWVSSSFQTVKAVWRNYPALAKFFRAESEDANNTDIMRKKYLGLYKYLTSPTFLYDLACMKDILRELQSLSLKLQQRDSSLVSSFCYVQQTVKILSAMKTRGGKSISKAEQCVSVGQFKGVSLVGDRVGKIDRHQFFQAVVDNLTARMPTDDLVQLLQPLDKSMWPQNQEDLILHGEAEVRRTVLLRGGAPQPALRPGSVRGGSGSPATATSFTATPRISPR